MFITVVNAYEKFLDNKTINWNNGSELYYNK